jgi:hypothetical protein
MTIRETCLQRAEESRLAAQVIHCRASAEAKAAALKAAAVYKMIAGWAESMEGSALADRCMAAADDYLHSAKPYAKRAFSKERAAYVKGAAVLREIAELARKPEPRQRRRGTGPSFSLPPDPEPTFPPSEEYTFGGRYIGPSKDNE